MPTAAPATRIPARRIPAWLALALTLGVILAVSSGAPTSHVTQQQSGNSSHP